ncbi:MAG: hypothetical protein K9G49_07765 [Taibaiella sp.]|nr:hypothetical protein [Taibaiella sp.]
MKDKEVKEKLESLSTLSGGIVYGKEEAWEKLQARMDNPAAKKIAINYRLAAAAVLLLCVSIIGFYFLAPEKQVAVIQPLTPSVIQDTQDTETMAVAVPVTAAPTTTMETPIVQQNDKSIAHKKQELPQTRYVVKVEPTVVVPEPLAAATPIISNIPPKPVSPAVKKMRVVHINDLGKATEVEDAAIAYSGPSLDISKMKVVSIYDVQRQENLRKQEEEIITIVRINRPHGNMFTFPNPFSRSNQYERPVAQSPFSIRLNRNN